MRYRAMELTAKCASFTRLARRVIGQPFYGWFKRAQFVLGRFNGLDWFDE